MSSFPRLLVADAHQQILDIPQIQASGRSGLEIYPLDSSWLIPLPKGSQLYFLPQRSPIGMDKNSGMLRCLHEYQAVAAFLPPGYTIFSLSAFEKHQDSSPLPLYAYCAVCWYRRKFYVPAVRIDKEIKHNPDQFQEAQVKRQVQLFLRRFPKNRLVAHHGLVCALQYRCPNAQNLFLCRWEAPIAVSGGCNASCWGCISRQQISSVPASHDRIPFVPSLDEIVPVAVAHLKKAPRAMISFGQGCEGEPLLQSDLIEAAIREIRRQTSRGTIHINTNGSLPVQVEKLAQAGLDSIRISVNSVRAEIYSAYYRQKKYRFEDVLESFQVSRKNSLFVSMNYLTFPGVTDQPEEVEALCGFLKKFKPNMIQWRNLNIDPDWYVETIEKVAPLDSSKNLGVPVLFDKIRKRFPRLRFGYFNPPVRD